MKRFNFGNVVLIVFIFAQILDGTFTYMGVTQFGIKMESNPILVFLMNIFGIGQGLSLAKIIACLLGIVLHLGGLHIIVALLVGFYLTAAVAPWFIILWFQ